MSDGQGDGGNGKTNSPLARAKGLEGAQARLSPDLEALLKKSFSDVNKLLAKTKILFEEVRTLNKRNPVEDSRNKVTIFFRVQRRYCFHIQC